MTNSRQRTNEGIAIANNLPKELYPTMEFKTTAYPHVNNKEMVDKVNKAPANV